MTERERLIELISDNLYLGGLEEKIADHLLSNGVIVPPCKIGDIVYDTTFGLTHDQGKVITEGKVIKIDAVTGGLLIVLVTTEPLTLYGIYPESFGKTTFFNREEAEAAVKEREKDV